MAGVPHNQSVERTHFFGHLEVEMGGRGGRGAREVAEQTECWSSSDP